MRREALIPQGSPLFHTEAMLLIHHCQTKVAERDPFLDQRMCADNDIHVAPRDETVQLGLHSRGHAARQQRNAQRPVRQDSAESSIRPPVVRLPMPVAEHAR